MRWSAEREQVQGGASAIIDGEIVASDAAGMPDFWPRASTRTTQLYDRREGRVTLDEVVKINIRG